MTSLAPQTFIPGYRLQSGTDLNTALANPQWSTTMSLEATTGGTANTSAKIVNTITNITSATAGAGVTIPRSAIGRYLHIINSSANTVNVYAEGDATINGIAGNFGYDLPAGRSITLYGADTTAWLVDDASGGAQEYFVNIAALKAVTPTAGQFADVGGYYTAGDGGGGQFYGVTAGGPYTDNGGTIIVPTGGDGSTAWLRIVNGTLDVKMFGARGNGVASEDDTGAIQAALNIAGDIYIPDGTYILATKTTIGTGSSAVVTFLQIPNNVRLSGSRNAILKLVNNAGNYTAVMTPKVLSGLVENIQLNGFTLDQNNQNNTTCSISTDPNAPDHVQRLLCGIYFLRVMNSVYVEGMSVINAPGWHAICLNGPNTTDIRVNNNEILFQRCSTLAAGLFYDNSAIYINANGFQCNDNYVYNITGSGTGNYTGAASGIEVHGANGQTCRNQVFRYQAVINVVGFSTGQGITYLNNLVVNENVATECAAGIAVYGITGVGIKGFEICDNLLSLDASLFTFVSSTVLFGIQIINSTGSAGDVAEGIISGNIIKYDGTIILAQKTFIADASAGILINALSTISNISVRFNSIYGAPIAGIRVQQQTSFGLYDKIDVSDNLISDAGLNTPSSLAKCFSVIWSGIITNSKCLNNQIDNTTAALTVTNGVYANDVVNASFFGRIDDGITPGTPGNVLTITSGLQGTVAVGQTLLGTGAATPPTILSGSGNTWTISGAALLVPASAPYTPVSFGVRNPSGNNGLMLVADKNICRAANNLTLGNRYSPIIDTPNIQYVLASAANPVTLVPTPGTEIYRVDWDMNTTARTLTMVAFNYPVPNGKRITIQIVNTSSTGPAVISFGTSTIVIATGFNQNLTTTQRCQFEVTWDAAAQKWYQSSAQVVVAK